MNKITKNTIIILGLVTLGIAAAGVYKFNYLANKDGYGVDGNNVESNKKHSVIVYTSKSGETVEAQYQVDGPVEVYFMQHDGVYLKAFTAKQVQSASGAKYKGDDGQFTFWTKGESASIFDKDEKIIFQGDVNPNKPKEEWFVGRLIFGHESQTFQKCGSNDIFWLTDPKDLVNEKYQNLVEGKGPYSEVYAEVVGVLSEVEQDEDGFAADYDFEKRLTVSDVSMEPLDKYPNCSKMEGKPIAISNLIRVYI